MTSLAAQTPAPSATPQQRVLPPMRTRKNSDDYIFIDADTYQAAFLNIQLPHGVRLEFENVVYRQIKKQKEREKLLASAIASRRAAEKKQEKLRQKLEAQQKKKQLADMERQQKMKEKAERDRQLKQEQEAAAAIKRAETLAKQEAAAKA